MIDLKTDTKQTMKRINLILSIILLLLTGCGGSKQSTEDFITVDVTKSYSPKRN
jgi:hypothetical protein